MKKNNNNKKIMNSSRKIKPEKSRKRKSYKVNLKHKDTLFRKIFTYNKQWLLDLYNAVNGTNYTNPDDIEFTTVKNAVYMGMKNDISFLITDTMNFYEHQSSYNPNMPLRMLIYAGMVYSSYADDESNSYNIYSSKTGKLPLPKLICFYNGESDKPESMVLKLSDAFEIKGETKPDIEVIVTMLNINYGHNKRLMEACKPLNEYAWFIEEIRKNKKNSLTVENAVDKALDEMPVNFKIRSYLISNRSEVRRMCITEFDEEKVRRAFKREAQEESERADKEKGRADKAESRADAEKNRADKAESRADAAESELARYKAKFGSLD